MMCIKRVFGVKKRILAHSTSPLLKNAFIRKEMLVLALVSLILHNSMHLHVSQCFHCVKTDNVQKTHNEFFAHLTSFLLKNQFTRRELLVLALVSPIVHNSMQLDVSHAFIALKPIMCMKRVLAHLTSFLLENAFKRRKTLDSALVILILHNLMRLQVSKCVHCVKIDNVHKTSS